MGGPWVDSGRSLGIPGEVSWEVGRVRLAGWGAISLCWGALGTVRGSLGHEGGRLQGKCGGSLVLSEEPRGLPRGLCGASGEALGCAGMKFL